MILEFVVLDMHNGRIPIGMTRLQDNATPRRLPRRSRGLMSGTGVRSRLSGPPIFLGTCAKVGRIMTRCLPTSLSTNSGQQTCGRCIYNFLTPPLPIILQHSTPINSRICDPCHHHAV